MTEWIITSSVLILVVIILRTVLKGKISLRLQYALWALVLVRLLIPGSLFGSVISVMNAVPNEPIGSYQEEPGQQVQPPAISAEPVIPSVPVMPEVPAQSDAPAVTLPPVSGHEPVVVPEEPVDIPWEQVLRAVWYVGMAAMALCLLISNLRFWLRLRRTREVLKYSPPTLYMVQGIETPCLFGLFSPAIYVTPEVAEDKGALAHVLAHEEIHYRHGDHIWSVLRCLCLVLHWYNPLVWLAAALSRRDAELACDEGAIRRLGEEQRAAYGRTLISLTCTRHGGLFQTATTMTGSKKSIKERIVLIAKKPKMKLYTLIAVILIAAITVGCTFTGRTGISAWADGLTVEDLRGAVELRNVRSWKDYSLSDAELEELLTILRGIDNGQVSKNVSEEESVKYNYDYSLAYYTGNDVQMLSSISFSFLDNGAIGVNCFGDLGYLTGLGDKWKLLDSPELYDFIVEVVESHQDTSETDDGAELLDQYVSEMMKDHAAELTAQLGRDVSVGGVMETNVQSTGAAGTGFSVQAYRVHYYLIHDLPESEDGTPVYGHIVAYTQYMFVLQQGGSTILLGHADETTLANMYSAPEMIDKYGDTYTAAAMEMYYRYQAERAFSVALLANPDAVEVAYFDLNGDGWDEFIIKTGTCEADYEYVFYTYRNGVQGAEPIGQVNGGHSYLAVSKDGALIIAGGQMDVEWAYQIMWDGSNFTSEQLFMRSAESGGYTQWPERVPTIDVGDIGTAVEIPESPTGALNMMQALLNATMDNSTLTRAKDNTEGELVRSGATMDVLKSAAENLQVLQDSETFDSHTGGIYLWLGDSGDRHISFYAGKEPYQVTICYAGDGINESAVTNNPQLYLFLMAAAEMQNVELHDLDGDGFLEGIIWPFSGNQRNIVIYDMYDGALQRIDVNETMNSKASEFTGQIANIHPDYNKMVRIVNEAGQADVYEYHDGTFSYICPLSDVIV